MSILTDDLNNIEPVPLAKLGWQVWDVGPEKCGTAQLALIEALQKHLAEDIGLSGSTSTLFDLVRSQYPPVIGIDVYTNNPGISRAGGTVTLPFHFLCRVIGPVWFNFLLIAPKLIFNHPKVICRGKTDYNRIFYANDYKEIKKRTLLDLTGTEDALSTIGAFVRDDYIWEPLSIEDSYKLNHRGR